MSCPGIFMRENLWKKGEQNFLPPKKFMVASVKIYGKKRGTIAKKKGLNKKTTSWTVIAKFKVVLVSMNILHSEHLVRNGDHKR